MKKLILSALICVLSITVFSQNAVKSAIDLPMLSAVKSKLESATGYTLQSSGKWKKAKNKIPYTDPEGKKPPTGKKALGIDNFDVLELRSITINEIPYSVLIVKYMSGTYRFPNSEEGWKMFEVLDYYIFKPSKLAELFSDSDDFSQPRAVALDPLCSGTIENYNSKDVNGIIENNAFKTTYTNAPNTGDLVIVVGLNEEKGKQSVKFRLIKSYSKNLITGNYLRQDNLSRFILKSYYEADFKDFKNFIGASSLMVTKSNLLQSGDFSGYYELAMSEYNSGDYIGAVADFNKAAMINHDINDYLFFASRGNAKHHLGDYSGAIEDYDLAIQLKPVGKKVDPNWAKAYFNRGVSKFFLKDKKSACADWKQASDLGVAEAQDYIKKYCK